MGAWGPYVPMTLFGAFLILVAIFNWEFAFRGGRARLFMSGVGRLGLRIAYGATGALALGYGLMSIASRFGHE